MSNPTSPSPSAFPQVASKKWSCSELQAGNQRLMESKVEDSSGDVKAVASYADQLRSRVEAGTLIWFPFVVGIPFESMICFSKKKRFSTTPTHLWKGAAAAARFCQTCYATHYAIPTSN